MLEISKFELYEIKYRVQEEGAPGITICEVILAARALTDACVALEMQVPEAVIYAASSYTIKSFTGVVLPCPK